MSATPSSLAVPDHTPGWRAQLVSFVLGTASGVLRVPGPSGVYHLAYSDAHQSDCLSENRKAGWYGGAFRPEPFFSKTSQYAAIRRITPDLAFEGYSVDTVQDLPDAPADILTVRPDRSAGSRGSAVFLGLGPARDRMARSMLNATPGPFQVHRFVPGTPFFVNGVMRDGRLSVADIWRCFTLVFACRPVLVSVVDMDQGSLPPRLIERLGTLLQGLGLQNGPVHFELIDTSAGPRLIKFAARLATDPLPALCDLQGRPGQLDLFADCFGITPGQTRAAKTPLHVADYSFIHTHQGQIRGLKHADLIQSLPGFSHYYMAPKIGETAAITQDGYSYAATLFLAHASKDVLHDSIAQLDALNIAGALDLDAAAPPAQDHRIIPLSQLEHLGEYRKVRGS